MSLHAQTAAYDPDNIFAKILRGELPCEKVYEDAFCLAFMDIMPRSDGHVLVIPKSPARNIIDIDPVALAAMMAASLLLTLRERLLLLRASGVLLLFLLSPLSLSRSRSRLFLLSRLGV